MQVNDGANGERIMMTVETHPGIHLREIQRSLGISFSTVRYHVRRLTGVGKLEIEHDARYSRVFLRAFPAEHRSLAAVARGESAMRVLGHILRSQGASNKDICEGTGLSKSTVSKDVGLLVRTGLVRRSISLTGSRILLPETGSIGPLSLFFGGGLKKAVENYVELWEF